MNSQSGYTFVDDSQLSVCEKINKYFAKKTSVSIINESESDSSEEDSFSRLDESFADLLNSNAHVTLMRKSKKEKDLTMAKSLRKDDSHIDLAGSNDVQSHTNTKWINHEDSFQYDTNNWMDKVTDESFLEIERQCNAYGDEQKLLSIAQNDTTLLFDIEEPSFLDETSICGRQSMSSSMLSPMKQVAMRRPSTILEESTIRSINSINTSSEVSSDSSSLIIFEDVPPVISTLKPNVTSYRPSLVNVFPVNKRKGFYDDLETVSEVANVSVPTSPKWDDGDKDNSICLMTFNDTVTEETGSSFQDNDTRDQFNDTLEAVDYYLEQGKKLMDKTIAVKIPTTPNAIFSPKNRNNSLLKHTLAKRHLRSISGDSLNMSFLK